MTKDNIYSSFEEYLKREPEDDRKPKPIKTTLGRISGRNSNFDLVVQRSELEGYADQYSLSLALHNTDKFIKSFIMNRRELVFICEVFEQILRGEI